jgi:hypothetical protein
MMDSSGFLALLRALTHLSSTQLERAQQHIQHHLHADLLRQTLSEHQRDAPIFCPHCQSAHVIHWGNLTAHFAIVVKNVSELSIS